jgi:hypothetical protein
MSANLNYWYPPATVKKNREKDNWEYCEEAYGRKIKHKFFRIKSEAICFAEKQMKKNKISHLTIYTKEGHISTQKESRLRKAIREYKDEAVTAYRCELYDLRQKIENLIGE